jgi:hypothetical protein
VSELSHKQTKKKKKKKKKKKNLIRAPLLPPNKKKKKKKKKKKHATVLARERVRCVRDQQRGFSRAAVADNDALEVLHV